MTPTVWRGSPPDLQMIEVVDYDLYRDGGTMRFELAGGDVLVVPANMMGMTRSATPRPAVDEVMPDGSIVKVSKDMVLIKPDRIVIPGGRDVIDAGDGVILVATSAAHRAATRLFRAGRS